MFMLSVLLAISLPLMMAFTLRPLLLSPLMALRPAGVVAVFAAFLLLGAVMPTAALAQSTVDLGPALGAFQPYIDAIVTALIAFLIGWALYELRAKLNISIDDSMRDALQTWLQRQASSLVADGFVKVDGLKITVGNAALANVLNLALAEIPDAIKFFGLDKDPTKLADMIVDKLPHVPAVASAVAATAAPAK